MTHFVEGQPAIVKADGSLDYDFRRALSAGERQIRAPALARQGHGHGDFTWATGGCQIVLHAGPPLDQLPVGATLMFTVAGRGDVRLPPGNGKTIGFFNYPSTAPLEFLAGDGVTIAVPAGKRAHSSQEWEVITLIKTGPTSWEASGDLAGNH